MHTQAVAVEEEEPAHTLVAAVEEDTSVCTLGLASGPEEEHCTHIFPRNRRPVTLWSSWV